MVGGSGGDRGLRDWLAALDPKTGDIKWKTYSIPAPGEPGSETWKDKDNAWLTGGGAFYGTGSYDPAEQPHLLGLGQSGAGVQFVIPARRQSLYDSAIAFDATSGKITWWHQYTPNDNRDYDETGSHILIDTKINGEDRKTRRACRAATASPTPSIVSAASSSRPRRHVKERDLDQGHRPQDRQAGRLRSEHATSRSTTRAPPTLRTR